MAAVSEAASVDDSKKVCFTDRDRLNSLCSTISAQLDIVFRKLTPAGENHDDSVIAFMFPEKFDQAIKANTCYAGPASASSNSKDNAKDANDTEDEESYLQTVLLPRVDALAVEVTKKRSTYPTVCSEHLRANLRVQHRKLVLRHKAATKSRVAAATSRSNLEKDAVICSELTSLVSSVAADLSGFKKESTSLFAKYERLRESREMTSATDKQHDSDGKNRAERMKHK